MSAGWHIIKHGDELHVLPRDDARPHRCAEDCWCGPFLYDGIWVHAPSNHEKSERWN